MLYWFENHSNEIRRNAMDVFFLSGKYSSGFPIHFDNTRDALALFIARTLITTKWHNSSDGYFSPDKIK
jgi:hypothetical protein